MTYCWADPHVRVVKFTVYNFSIASALLSAVKVLVAGMAFRVRVFGTCFAAWTFRVQINLILDVSLQKLGNLNIGFICKKIKSLLRVPNKTDLWKLNIESLLSSTFLWKKEYLLMENVEIVSDMQIIQLYLQTA